MPTLSAGELAKLLDVDPSTLRYWVTRGHLTDPPRTRGGHKRFDPKQVAADYARTGDTVPARLQAFLDAHDVGAALARASTEDLRAELARREERGAA